MADGAQRVVIVGGGFGGLYAARELSDPSLDVTLVDRRNHHLFQPLLYQVATAALAAPDVAAPIRKVLRRQKNTRVLLGEVRAVDVRRRRVVLADGVVPYDAVIVASGATHTYFGHDEWAAAAPGLKDLSDALEIRRRILLSFEAAEREGRPAERAALLTFAIIGAGPTGVELAGAVQEIAQRTLACDFRSFDPRDTRVVLIDAVDRVLPQFPPTLSARAQELLRARGVTIKLSAPVTRVDDQGVVAGDARIDARTVLWAAGVRASPLGATLGVPLDKAGRVLVEPDLSIPEHPEVFVVGDLAAIRQDGSWVPGMAAPAIQEGRHAAHNVLRLLEGRALEPFRYRDKGALAAIGRSAAVARIGRFELAGRFAWMVWLVVHVLYLIGFRNRAAVLLDWAFAYFTYDRSARVILECGAGEPAVPARQAATGGGRA